MEHVLFANHSLIFIPWFTVGLMVLMAINHRLLYLTICEADRYEVKFEGGRYDTVACALIPMGFHGAFLHANLGHLSLSGCLNPSEVVKLKEENLMYSAMREKEVKEQKALQLQVPDFAGEQMFFF